MYIKATSADLTVNATPANLKAGVVVVIPARSTLVDFVQTRLRAGAVNVVAVVTANSQFLAPNQTYAFLTASVAIAPENFAGVRFAVGDLFGVLDDDLIFTVLKVVEDLAIVNDAIAKSFGKTLSDSITITDDTTVQKTTPGSITGSETEALSISDVTRFTFAQRSSDLVTLADESVIVFGKPSADSFTVSDAAALSPSTAYTDLFNISDSTTQSIAKVLADTVTLADDLGT